MPQPPILTVSQLTRQIKDAIAGGFIYKKSAAHLLVRGDRRSGRARR